MSSNMRIVYTTVPRLSHAEVLAKKMVEQNLAACVNIIPGIMAVYEWEGQMKAETECILLVKTTKAAVHAVMQALKDEHPFELPVLFSLKAKEVEERFGSWVTKAVQTQS